MTDVKSLQDMEKHIPVVGDVNIKSPFTYQATRTALALFNAIQMVGAEAYINGLEVPDSALKWLLDTSLPIIYKYFPYFIVADEWVLKESEQLARIRNWNLS